VQRGSAAFLHTALKLVYPAQQQNNQKLSCQKLVNPFAKENLCLEMVLRCILTSRAKLALGTNFIMRRRNHCKLFFNIELFVGFACEYSESV
jgi:hypothetical protein